MISNDSVHPSFCVSIAEVHPATIKAVQVKFEPVGRATYPHRTTATNLPRPHNILQDTHFGRFHDCCAGWYMWARMRGCCTFESPPSAAPSLAVWLDPPFARWLQELLCVLIQLQRGEDNPAKVDLTSREPMESCTESGWWSLRRAQAIFASTHLRRRQRAARFFASGGVQGFGLTRQVQA